MNLPANFVVIDCETSGLSADRHALLSIGAVTTSGREFYRECLFDETKESEAEAMAVNGFAARPSAANAVFPERALFEFLSWLEDEFPGRWIFGGKNPGFDYGFLKAVVNEWGPLADDRLRDRFEKLLCRRALDLHTLAYWWAMAQPFDFTADDFSTDSIYAALGFGPELKPHHALTGAKLEMAVFEELARRGFFQKTFSTALAGAGEAGRLGKAAG